MMQTAGDTWLGRLAVGVAASALIFAITFALLIWWMEQFPDRSDFHTNGRMWIVLTIEMIDLFVVPVFVLIVFCLAIPRWLAHEYRCAQGAPRSFPLIFSVAAIQLVLLSAFYWGSSERIWFIGVVPVVAVTAAAAAFYMKYVIRRNKRMNRDLSRGEPSGRAPGSQPPPGG